MSNEVLRFELRRQSDDLVYRFTRMTRADGSIGFKRADGDYWIARSRTGAGWRGTTARRPAWAVRGTCCPGTRADQGAAPPEGDWVSRKGAKSYVHSLTHLR